MHLYSALQCIALILLIHLPLLHSHQKIDPSLENQPFVSCRFEGQLGNQLFEIAAASALAWDNQATPWFPNICSKVLAEHVFFRCNTVVPKIQTITHSWKEPAYSYTKIRYRPNIQLIGYFQSERYFAHHRDRILELFAPHPNDTAYIQKKYGSFLKHPQTVGVQVRYYKHEDPTSNMYPQFGIDYLTKAIACFPKDSLFIVSSNNIAYVRKNFPTTVHNVLFLEGEPNYIDLWILSMCKDNIITNSSFGWWGAWLNNNVQKKVYYPKPLFYKLPLKDYCPEEWIGIEAVPEP